MDRWCRVDSEHLRAIAAKASRPIVITKARWRMYEEWLNYGEASEIKDAVIDGKESGGNRAIQPVFGVHRRTAADGDRAHGAFPCENSSIVPFAATVDAAAGREDTIDPTFEYRGHAVPPQRKLEAASRANASMADQLPEAIKCMGATHEPPTLITFGSAK